MEQINPKTLILALPRQLPYRILHQFQSHGPISPCSNFVVAVSEQIKRNVEAIANFFLPADLLLPAVVTAANQKVGGHRHFGSPVQELSEPFCQILMLGEREALWFIRKKKIDVGAKFVGGFKNFLFRIYLCARPDVTLRRFKRTSRRIYLGKKLTQFRHPHRFLKLEQMLGTALQIVIAWATTFGGPWHFEGFVIGAEFDGEVGLHATLRVQVAVPPAVLRPVWKNSLLEPGAILPKRQNTLHWV